MGQVTELHKVYLDSRSKSDHFILGAIAAACAFLAQSNPYGKLGVNVETLFLAGLIMLSMAAFFAYRKIEDSILVLKFNVEYLEGKNKGDVLSYSVSKNQAEKYSSRTAFDFHWRNFLMALGFVVYVTAKVLQSY
ncbi:hypothetical protein D3C77_187960 [compost metagenome]